MEDIFHEDEATDGVNNFPIFEQTKAQIREDKKAFRSADIRFNGGRLTQACWDSKYSTTKETKMRVLPSVNLKKALSDAELSYIVKCLFSDEKLGILEDNIFDSIASKIAFKINIPIDFLAVLGFTVDMTIGARFKSLVFFRKTNFNKAKEELKTERQEEGKDMK